MIRFGEHDLRAEVAATPEARARGLMFRRRLAPDSGMLFLFPPDTGVRFLFPGGTGGFWMKNTLIPLSIAFLERTGNRRYRVLEVLDMQPCRADPCPTYAPRDPFDAAVEAPLGWFVRRGIGPDATARVVAGLEPTPS